MKMHNALIAVLAAITLQACGEPRTDIRSDLSFTATRPVIPATPQPTAGAIYQQGYELNLFQDQKARNVGDILTIVLVERTSAKASLSTSTKKDSSASIDNPTLFGSPLTNNGNPLLTTAIGAEREFSGKGDAAQSNRLDGNLSVTVAERLPNGNLLVRGEKRLVLNRGEEFVQIQGIIRQADIQPDNTVQSSRVADARIIYSARGQLADATAKGWLTKFFEKVIYPF